MSYNFKKFQLVSGIFKNLSKKGYNFKNFVCGALKGIYFQISLFKNQESFLRFQLVFGNLKKISTRSYFPLKFILTHIC